MPRSPTDMESTVEGELISEEEWSDDSWKSPGYIAQERRRRELKAQGKEVPSLSATGASSYGNGRSTSNPKPRPPPQRRRAPLPRMPADAIHIVGRPQSPIDLTKVPPWQLHEALLKAASLPDQPPATRDRLRTHPTNNTFTLSVVDSRRAQAYLCIKSINVGTRTVDLHVYAPPPDDAVRGIMFHAFDDFSDEEILADLQASNPDMPIVSGRRMGQTRHLVVTLTSKDLPKWIFYHGTDIRLYPFYNRVESCYNCRKVGHRTDVCPLPRKQRCRRCGEEHPPPKEGEASTCAPRCIVCGGAHNTSSSNCKYRFVKKTPHTPQTKQAQGPARVTRHSASHSGSSSSRSPSLRARSSSFPPLDSNGQPQRRASRSRSRTRRSRSRSTQRAPSASRLQSSSQGHGEPPKMVAWQHGPPASLASNSQVREMAKENSALRTQISTQQAQISAQQSQIAKLTTYIQSLEAKIDRVLASHTSTPTSTPASHTRVSSSASTSTAPQPQSSNKRKAATSTASLHTEADNATAVTAAISALETKLEARFNVISELIATHLQEFHAFRMDTINTYTTLKSSVEATQAKHSTQLAALQETTDTSQNYILEEIRKKPATHQRQPARQGLTPPQT